MQYLGNDYFRFHRTNGTSLEILFEDIKKLINEMEGLELSIELDKKHLKLLLEDKEATVIVQAKELITNAHIITIISRKEDE